ncbi:outer membrane lipoprotein-sorting protein [Gemmatimonadota bacterium]
MKIRVLRILTIAIVVSLCTFIQARAQQIDTVALAKAVITHVDSLLRGKSNQGVFKMTVVRPDWSRSMTMESWERGQDLSFIEVLEPQKEAGTAFLKREGQMWTWLPDIERTIKIPPSMMMESWMGSDFTNDDLMHESSIVDDYYHGFLGCDTLEVAPCYVVQLKPKPEVAVVWGRIVVWARIEDLMPVREEYYDERGRLIRTMFLEDIKEMKGRVLPTRWTLVPHLKEGQKTIFEMIEIDFNVKIRDRVFTRQNLERAR